MSDIAIESNLIKNTSYLKHLIVICNLNFIIHKLQACIIFCYLLMLNVFVIFLFSKVELSDAYYSKICPKIKKNEYF